MRKKGVSLVVLIISVSVMLLLLGITTASIGNSVKNSRMSAFASDLVSIEDAVNTYYIQNGEFPIATSKSGKNIEYIYESDKLVDINDEGEQVELNNSKDNYLEAFKSELIGNKDLIQENTENTSTVFYKIDLEKIGVEKTKRGLGKSGENDIYVVSYPNQNIYYVGGLVVDKQIYFSLFNISNRVKIEKKDKEAADTTSIISTTNGITVKRDKKVWTNELGIIIDTYLESNESIYVRIPGKSDDIKLSTTTGQNIIKLKSLDGSLGLSSQEIAVFNTLSNNERYITIVKKQNNVENAAIKVTLANFELEKPEFPSDSDSNNKFVITSNTSENELTFTPTDKFSGVSKVRYEYLTKYNEDGNIESLNKDMSGNAVTELDYEYMLSNAKIATLGKNGKVSIKIPKNIEAIYIAVFDKAGNMAGMVKNVRTSIYAGVTLSKITKNLEFKYAIKSNDGRSISQAVTSISTDGTNFTNEKTLNLKENSGIYSDTVSFENPNSDNVYIKIVVKDSNNKVETRVEKVDIESMAYDMTKSVVPGIIYEENKYFTDSDGKSVIVPAGFKVSSNKSEQSVNNGLVILDKKDNEYVWIPCTIDGSNGSIKYEKWEGSKSTVGTVKAAQTSDDSLPTGITSEEDQITKYGGYYVARYEASLPDEQTTATLMVTKTFSSADNNRTDIGKAQSKAGKIVWNRIDYNNAKTVSENVISTSGVQSGLITGKQWDTMLKFIASAGVNVDTDCSSWGNYYDKTGYSINGYYRTQNADVVYTKGSYTKSSNGYLLLTTGKFGEVISTGSPKNIYDVAGNVWEWSAETVAQKGGSNTVVGNKLFRGGGYGNYGSDSTASYRNGGNAATSTYASVGFRFVLYIK